MTGTFRCGCPRTPENTRMSQGEVMGCRRHFNAKRREDRARKRWPRRTEPATAQPEPEVDIDRAYYEMCRDLAHQRRAAHTADLSRRMAEHRERYGEPHWLTRGKK